jgi:hypothetical protein
MQNELDVLRDVSRRLESAGIAYMLTGSMAMNYYAQPRMTRDIDIVLQIDSSNVGNLVRLFTPDYYVSTEAVTQSVANKSMFNLIHQESIIKVDCMVRKDNPYRLAEFERRLPVKIADFSTWIVSKEDLILSKLYWARDSRSERQLSDVKNLVATSCDFAYISHWARQLGVADLWAEVAKNE